MINLIDAPPMLEDYAWEGAKCGKSAPVAKALCSIMEEEMACPGDRDECEDEDVHDESDDEHQLKTCIYPASGGNFILHSAHEPTKFDIYPCSAGDLNLQAVLSEEYKDSSIDLIKGLDGCIDPPPISRLRRSTSRLSDKLTQSRTLRRCKARIERTVPVAQESKRKWWKILRC